MTDNQLPVRTETKRDPIKTAISAARSALMSGEPLSDRMVETFADAEDELWRLRAIEAAARAALNELGVPGEGYPAPVANAVDILTAALEGPSS